MFVSIETPYEGDIENNLEYLKKAILNSIALNEIPLVSQSPYTCIQEFGLTPKEFVLDKLPEQYAFYIDNGMSEEMNRALRSIIDRDKLHLVSLRTLENTTEMTNVQRFELFQQRVKPFIDIIIDEVNILLYSKGLFLHVEEEYRPDHLEMMDLYVYKIVCKGSDKYTLIPPVFEIVMQSSNLYKGFLHYTFHYDFREPHTHERIGDKFYRYMGSTIQDNMIMHKKVFLYLNYFLKDIQK